MTKCIEVPGAAWDALLPRFRDAAHEQSFAYAAARWGARQVRCVVVERDGVMLGGAAAVGIQVFGRGLAVVKFGPLYRCGAGGNSDHVREIVRGIKSFFCLERKFHLSILPQAPLEEEMLVEGLAEEGFRAATAIGDARRYFVDLSCSAENMREGLAKWWRRNLRAAERHGLRVEEFPGKEGLTIFQELFDELKRRKDEVDSRGLKEMADLAASPSLETRPRVFLAFRDGMGAVAGAVVTTIGERACYAFGAQSTQGAKMSANYVLQWAVVDRLRAEKRCRWYDLGGDANAQGLVQFKTGFIGKTGRIAEIPPWRDYCESGASALVARAAFALRGR